MKLFISTLVFLLATIPVFSQKTSWKQLNKQGDALLESGKYLEAAESFEAAFKLKSDKEKIASKAGTAYFNARNYAKALKMLRPIKKEEKDYPLAGFWYAKSLKAMGEFDKASAAFKNFRRKYLGEKTDHVLDMARTEIEGCELGMDWEGLPVVEKATAFSINSDAQEFGITAFSDDIIYFGTNANGTVKMMRSQNTNGNWSDPILPDFPSGPSGHTAQGAFSSDRSAFYFTVCDNTRPWDSREANCEIYASKRVNDSWSTPEKLRDYLKGDGTSATHPFVYQEGEMEVLIFSTNRSGGEGGMDLWKTSRPMDSDAFDFSFPQHLGNNINSKGDEITPFINQSTGTLYFSSNGFANLGGFDIFSVPTNDLENGYIENIGYPYNSNSDDYYYTMAPQGTVEFFTSNRSTDDWESTTDDNLFQVGMASNPVATIRGTIKDKNTEEGVMHSSVMLMEVSGDNEMLLVSQATNNGEFEMPILAGKNYKIEARADGYNANAISLSSDDFDAGSALDRNIYLQEAEMMETVTATVETQIPSTPVVSSPVVTSPVVSTPEVSTAPVNTWTEKATNTVESPVTNTNWTDEVSNTIASSTKETVVDYPSTVNSKPSNTTNSTNRTVMDNYSAPVNYNSATNNSTSTTVYNSAASTGEYTNSRFLGDGVRTSAPKHDGSYYKVQLSIVIDYNSGESEYQRIVDLGRLDTEYILARGWTRVLIADYFSKDEALRVLHEARKRGFPEAFLVRYENGFRKI